MRKGKNEMNIDFHGIGEVVATFKVEDGAELKPGEAVVLTGNGEVGHGSEDGKLCGVILHVEEDGYAGVQIGGLIEVGYSGDAVPAAGWEMLSVDGAGKVKCVNTDGVSCMIVSVDEGTMTAVIKL